MSLVLLFPYGVAIPVGGGTETTTIHFGRVDTIRLKFNKPTSLLRFDATPTLRLRLPRVTGQTAFADSSIITLKLEDGSPLTVRFED